MSRLGWRKPRRGGCLEPTCPFPLCPQTVFLLWNSLNDPLFGWLSDRQFLSSQPRFVSRGWLRAGSVPPTPSQSWRTPACVWGGEERETISSCCAGFLLSQGQADSVQFEEVALAGCCLAQLREKCTPAWFIRPSGRGSVQQTLCCFWHISLAHPCSGPSLPTSLRNGYPTTLWPSALAGW